MLDDLELDTNAQNDFKTILIFFPQSKLAAKKVTILKKTSTINNNEISYYKKKKKSSNNSIYNLHWFTIFTLQHSSIYMKVVVQHRKLVAHSVTFKSGKTNISLMSIQ